MKYLLPCLLWLSYCAGLPTASAQLKMNLNSGDGTYSFSVEPGTLPATSKLGSYYKVFVNTGDGHYFLGTHQKPASATTNTDLFDLSTFKHQYRSAGPFQPYAEFVEVYDDDKKPGRIVPITTFVPVAFTTNPEPPNTNPASLKLDWVRKVVPGHENTYIAVVKNTTTSPWYNCTVELSYDPDIFQFDNSILQAHLVAQPSNNTAGSSSTPSKVTIIIPTSLAPNQQINVFFPLHTKAALSAGTSVKVLTAKLTVGEPGFDTTVVAQNVKVELSQDPNRKTPSISVVSRNKEEIEYRIDFQNEGKGDATHVHITDELDTLLTDGIPVFVGSSHDANVNQKAVLIAPRVWQWNFNKIKLMGTHDPKYTADQEGKTKGFIRFKVRVRKVIPCQSIVNRARIVFDCNAAISTSFAFTPIACNAPIITPAPPTACADTAQVLPALTTVSVGATIKQLLPAAVVQQLKDNGYTNFKWYPATYLTAPLAVNTGVSMARPETYVLVATTKLPACSQRIYYVPVQPTGITTDSPILIEDAPGDCIANLTFFGGEPPYTYSWSPSALAQTTIVSKPPFSAYLDLAGKPAMTISVTDAAKCNLVFSPLKARCRVVPTTGTPTNRQ